MCFPAAGKLLQAAPVGFSSRWKKEAGDPCQVFPAARKKPHEIPVQFYLTAGKSATEGPWRIFPAAGKKLQAAPVDFSSR